MNFFVRRASYDDLGKVLHLYSNVVVRLKSEGIDQWDEVYPNEDILRNDIEKCELFLGKTEEELLFAYVVNKDFDDEYNNGEWNYFGENYRIIHRLCVNPDFQNQGLGSKVIFHIENEFRINGVEAVRLDCYSKNPYALKLYKSCGYRITGQATWRKGIFYLMEKRLN